VTVAELIAELQRMPQGAVVVCVNDCGYYVPVVQLDDRDGSVVIDSYRWLPTTPP
jgi:hypothetical protein